MKKQKSKIRIIHNGMYQDAPYHYHYYRRPRRRWSIRENIVSGLKWLGGKIWLLLKRLFNNISRYVRSWIFRNLGITRISWVKLSLVAIVAYLVLTKDMQFNFSLNAPFDNGSSRNWLVSQKDPGSKNVSSLLPATPGLVNLDHIENEAAKSYIKRFAKVAVEEMHRYSIPASIKMGQALLESRAGKSPLALESNNHFGIKCKRKCKGCTCRNYSDDDVYDMFRVFESAWASWREHSLLLANTSRYSKLKQHKKDYKAWAEGLRKAGYATDNAYSKKLIAVIEKYKLYKLDDM